MFVGEMGDRLAPRGDNLDVSQPNGPPRSMMAKVSVHLTKEHRTRVTAGDIPRLSNRWQWVVSVTSRPLYPKVETACAHWIRDWVGPTAGLDGETAESRMIGTLMNDDGNRGKNETHESGETVSS
jgi:hypothetical protein